MKKNVAPTMFILLISLITVWPVFAQTPTAPPSPTQGAKVKQIEDLKERLATKVAELRNLQPKAIYGKVKSQTVSSMTIETKTKDIKIELTDTIKIFQYLRGTRSKLTIEDVDNGDFVVVFGQYDNTIDILKASVILIDNTPPAVRISGTIKSRDEEEFTITVLASDKLEYVVDVEKTTKVAKWNGETLEKSGFSKLLVGDTVHAVGTTAPKDEKRISAKRLVDLGVLIPGASPTIAPSETEAPATSTPKSTPRPGTPTPKPASPTPRPTTAQ